ncbi:MAG: ABC transporter ATP-binding protein [Desulfuromonas sp.]|nr:MAG: ABC transporter ATP-binding protein [Desulfuromonas sp.]
MTLLSLRHLSHAFGSAPLLDDVSLQVTRGERICLLGRNGCGKSTLLKLIEGKTPPDAGTIDRRQGITIASLPQEVPRELKGSVFETIAAHLGDTGEQLCRFLQLQNALAAGDEGCMPEMLDLQHLLDDNDGWQLQQHVEQIIKRLDLSADADVATLSGGVLRRVLLARALATHPDILLLDEPTNHLDIASIEWLEQFLKAEGLTLVFVTHDRAFLRNLATRIIEIDRGRLLDFTCNYDTFLQRREEFLHAEEQEWARFDKKLAEEEVWIRQGIKARRTRNEGRVRALKEMRSERSQRRERSGKAKLNLLEAERSGQRVIEVENLSFSYAERTIVRDFSTTILRGDRIGIIGPNGAGKTTLVKLLLGECAPQHGQIKHGTNLKIVYFDQLREQLDEEKTVQQNLAPDGDTVLIGDRPRHVLGYLKDFLFTPERARTPVRVLSGGERNRLLLARLFLREANLLVLDEPTNDLDMETLDLLEERLADYQGTLFLVSHDRDFINRTATSTLVFEGDGEVREYVGGYEDWLRQRSLPEQHEGKPAPAKAAKPKPARPQKLSFKQKQELSELPAQIEQLENEQSELHAQLADPEFYRSAGDQIATIKTRLDELEQLLAQAYFRWEELEALPS